MADKKNKKKSPSRSSTPVPFTTLDMAEAYRHFLPLAERLPAEEIPVRRGDVTLARSNIDRGVEAIRPHVERISRILPEIQVHTLLELPALALVLIHADGRVPHEASAGEIETAFSRVSGLRELTLKYLEVAAPLGFVPEGRVRAIRAGRGKLDNARDCVAIAGVFHEFAEALSGKHPFSDEQLKELATTGTWLVQAITPTGGARAPAVRAEAAVLRDRFWRLVDERHDALRTVGVALFGIRNVEDHVPPLLSRVVAASSKPVAPAAPPGPVAGAPSGPAAASPTPA
jgi:hypothetical protein